LTLPVAVGYRQHDRLGRIPNAGKQRLESVSVDVSGRALFEALEIPAAGHRIQQRVAKAEAGQEGLIRDALYIETGPIGLIEIEHTALVDLSAPLLSFVR
jgi:hypothetical protein